jgi:hypothetical protein
MSTRSQGDGLESYVVSRLKGLGISAKQNPNSGAVRGDGDVASSDYTFECKTQHEQRGRVVRHMKIDADEFAKAQAEARQEGKQLVFVVENGEGQKVAVMDFDQFTQLLAREKQNDDAKKEG